MDLSDISIHATLLAQRSVTWSSDIGAVCGGLYFSSMKFVFTFFFEITAERSWVHVYTHTPVRFQLVGWTIGTD